MREADHGAHPRLLPHQPPLPTRIELAREHIEVLFAHAHTSALVSYVSE
eukprot:COSAG06_NODE_2306_length_7110_cov_99.335188_5_plen_49_part_00